MKVGRTVSLITAHLHRNISGEVMDALRETGLQRFYLYAARSPVIEKKKRRFPLLLDNDLAEDPLDTIFFLVNPAREDALAGLIIDKGQLYAPGRGSVLVEDVTLAAGHELCGENDIPPLDLKVSTVHVHPLAGICCILKRGQGNTIARVPLDTGTCVPVIHFGTGTGVRDKMGLLRITIPAEKEIIHAFASQHEADNIMDMFIDIGHLGQPGSGFIYTFPVKKGLVNIRVRRGEQRHAASIEQIITALDHIKGNTEWRQRRGIIEGEKHRGKKFIKNLIDLVLLCDGGTAAELVKAAMFAGAGGATVSGAKLIRPPDSPFAAISPAREACSMVIPEAAIETVTDALEKAGAFTDRCHGQVYLRQTFKAFTYLGK